MWKTEVKNKGQRSAALQGIEGLAEALICAGESVMVSFDITEDMLKFYNEDMEYIAEPGEFTVWIGGSSLTENEAKFTKIM